MIGYLSRYNIFLGIKWAYMYYVVMVINIIIWLSNRLLTGSQIIISQFLFQFAGTFSIVIYIKNP